MPLVVSLEVVASAQLGQARQLDHAVTAIRPVAARLCSGGYIVDVSADMARHVAEQVMPQNSQVAPMPAMAGFVRSKQVPQALLWYGAKDAGSHDNGPFSGRAVVWHQAISWECVI